MRRIANYAACPEGSSLRVFNVCFAYLIMYTLPTSTGKAAPSPIPTPAPARPDPPTPTPRFRAGCCGRRASSALVPVLPEAAHVAHVLRRCLRALLVATWWGTVPVRGRRVATRTVLCEACTRIATRARESASPGIAGAVPRSSANHATFYAELPCAVISKCATGGVSAQERPTGTQSAGELLFRFCVLRRLNTRDNRPAREPFATFLR